MLIGNIEAFERQSSGCELVKRQTQGTEEKPVNIVTGGPRATSPLE